MNASPKIRTYPTIWERKLLQLGQRSSIKESAENVASMATLPTITRTKNKTDSSPKHKTDVTTGSAALIVSLSETDKRLTRSATGAEDTVTPHKIARASSSASASSTAKKSAGTQPLRKKITLRRQTKITNQTVKVLLRLLL